MRFDFVVGEGYCTRFVDGGRFATDSPGRSDHRPSRNVSRTAVRDRDPPMRDYFQKPKCPAQIADVEADVEVCFVRIPEKG